MKPSNDEAEEFAHKLIADIVVDDLEDLYIVATAHAGSVYTRTSWAREFDCFTSLNYNTYVECLGITLPKCTRLRFSITDYEDSDIVRTKVLEFSYELP